LEKTDETMKPYYFIGDETKYLELEKKMILAMLDRTNLNVAKAARLLKVSRQTLYNRMNRHKIIISKPVKPQKELAIG
jgi:transcriptional regulator of acetoin/glycerol metabolism